MVHEKLTFSPLSRRQIEADFAGGHITSDAGLYLLREVEATPTHSTPDFCSEGSEYCLRGDRGDIENRIKDQRLSLFAVYTSSTHCWTNQWRPILSGFAYNPFERLRAYLKKTLFERMSPINLRLNRGQGGGMSGQRKLDKE